MITSLTDEWISQLEQAAFRHRIVFVHLGDAFPLTREVLLGRVPKFYSPLEYLEADLADSGLKVITDLETIGQIGGAEFGPLRARVHEDVDKNSQVVLLSRFPRERFPDVHGSPLLFEAKLITPPVYLKEGFGAEAIDQGQLPHLVLKCAIRELGESLCGSLDKVLFEEKDHSSLAGLDTEIYGALRSSGLVFLKKDNFFWAPPVDEITAQETLSAVVSEMRVPQLDLADVTKHCWTIERTLKQALRARANILWKENWKGELLDDVCLQAAVVDRARVSSYPEADSVNDLRDPLEWLTVHETLQVRKHNLIGELGLAQPLWRKFESEFPPVKDRVERSQLLRKGDLDTVARWASKISSSLSMSGSQDASLTIQQAPAVQGRLLKTLRGELQLNPHFKGAEEFDFMHFVVASLNFLVHTLETGPDYTKPFKDAVGAPKEKDIQDAYRAFLDSSGFAGFVANEVGTISTGRADVVLYRDGGRRYVTEVKRELVNASRDSLEKKYLEQSFSYQSVNVPLGHLLVLDLCKNTAAHEELLDNSMWIAHRRGSNGSVVASTLVTVVRGNRDTPSNRK